MKAKIFAKLKQEFSSLGLGDEILMARAESLAATGLVTDDNVDAVVAVQKRDLETLQKQNDARVSSALEKQKAKFEAEAKAKAEEEEKQAAKRKEDDEKKAKEKADADAKAKAEAKAEADKKAKAEKEAQEEEARQKMEKEGKVSAELMAYMKKERKEAEERLAAYEARLQQLMDDSTKRNTDYVESLNKLRESYEALNQANSALKKDYDTIKAENDAAKTAKAKAERDNFIKAKATELGVPPWRIEEGFLFAENADETAITDTLTKVANNIKTQQLPSNPARFPMGDNKPTESEITGLANSIVK